MCNTQVLYSARDVSPNRRDTLNPSARENCVPAVRRISKMLVHDAQREVRTVFAGGFWGQLVSAIIWLASAALATWVSPKAGIWTAVTVGFFIYPLTLLLIRLSGGRASLSPDNPLGRLGMQIAFAGSLPMLLLVPVTQLRLTLFYPALMVIMGAHYFP